jgi:hypothetical protein
MDVDKHLAVVFPVPRPDVQDRNAPQFYRLYGWTESLNDLVILRSLVLFIFFPGLFPPLVIIRQRQCSIAIF